MTDLEKVKSMVEFYFSDAAYRRDRFLRAKAAENKDGCAFCVPTARCGRSRLTAPRHAAVVNIDVLLSFNKLKALTTSAEDVVKAVEDSSSVTLSEDRKAIRRTEPLPAQDDSKERTVYVVRRAG